MGRVPIRIPLTLQPEWETRSWTTNPPRYDAHTSWAVMVRVTGDEPLRAAIAFGAYPAHRLDRPWPGRPDEEIDVRVWGATETEPTAEQLADPWLVLGERVSMASTWEPIRLDSDTLLMVVPRRDTTSRRRGRWIVRHDLQHELPPRFARLRTVVAATPSGARDAPAGSRS